MTVGLKSASSTESVAILGLQISYAPTDLRAEIQVLTRFGSHYNRRALGSLERSRYMALRCALCQSVPFRSVKEGFDSRNG